MASAVGRRLTPGRIVVYTILLLAAACMLVPLYVMLATSFKTLEQVNSGGLFLLPDPFTIQPWIFAWSSACIGADCNGLHPYFWNSVSFTLPAVLISTGIGAINGYILSKWRFPGSELFFGLLVVGMFVPFQMFLLPMAWTLGQVGLANSVLGLILVHSIYGIAFTTLFCRNFYVDMPTELVKAARVDGGGFLGIFWRIVLPLSVPILMVCVIWQFTQIWNDFLFGVTFTSGGGNPITVALVNMVSTVTGVKRYNANMAGAMIAALPTIIIYIVAGSYFVRGLTAGAVKG